jgi:hypothetical protein
MATGVARNRGYVVGFFPASLSSPFLFWSYRRHERGRRAEWLARRSSLAELQEVPIIESRVQRIWPVESEPDWPAYLLEDEDGRFALLSTTELAFLEPTFAKRALTGVLSPPDGRQILHISWAGDSLPPEAAELPLPQDDWPGDGDITVLDRAALPHHWRTVVDGA